MIAPMEDTLIRIHKNGRGMYFGSDANTPLFYLRDGTDEGLPDRHPTPNADSLLTAVARHLFWVDKEDGYEFFSWQARDFVFGFKNYDLMRSWIYDTRVLDHLHENGFTVAIMQGEVYHGHTQSVINKKTAVTLEDISIPEFIARHS